jgi:uncharacterized protein YndB with AHSA1/START domain
MEKRYEIYIKTTPEKLWDALTNPDLRSKYNFGLRVESDWTPGSSYEAKAPNSSNAPIAGRRLEAGAPLVEGENVEVDKPRKLVQTFRALWSDAVKKEGTSRVTWEIEQVADSCKLTVTHDQLRENANAELYGGHMMILSGLKTLLETGQKLTTPGSLMYT